MKVTLCSTSRNHVYLFNSDKYRYTCTGTKAFCLAQIRVHCIYRNNEQKDEIRQYSKLKEQSPQKMIWREETKN